MTARENGHWARVATGTGPRSFKARVWCGPGSLRTRRRHCDGTATGAAGPGRRPGRGADTREDIQAVAVTARKVHCQYAGVRSFRRPGSQVSHSGPRPS